MANLNVMFLLWLKLSATHILLPQQTFLNVIERKYKRQILLPDPIILDNNPHNIGKSILYVPTFCWYRRWSLCWHFMEFIKRAENIYLIRECNLSIL